MTESMLIYAILIPLAGALLMPVLGRVRGLREALLLLVTAANLWLAISLFGKQAEIAIPWCGPYLSLCLRLYHFSGFILLAIAGFGILIGLYSAVFLFNHRHATQFYFYMLISLALANGVALADHLIVLLFFWEGLLITLFGMIAIGSQDAWKTAVKALVIVGISDLCMMFGIALTGHLAGTLVISKISLGLSGLGAAAFIFLMIGAISKAGAIPFHSWIPDAARDAPLPFMALLPAALEKLLGIYFLARISLDMFKLTPDSWISPMMMIIGAITILVAVMMALIQTDYKRLLAYHAISQVGYMILGIGTAVPIGIVGGIFHMINHAMYKSCLFLTGGSVEKQAGTTDLGKLGGLARGMPVTFTCFIVAAASISGVPPFNGFFSKELVYDGALARGWIFYAAALLGSFLTAASFLKLGHAAYLGPASEANKKVREAPIAMLVPMVVIAGMCALFGLYNSLPLHNLIQPILGDRMEGHDCAGMPENMLLVAGTCAALVLALLNHWYGVRRTGRGSGAADHIHHAPILAPIYARAERRAFDPYDIGLFLSNIVAWLCWAVDRLINWISDSLAVGISFAITRWVRDRHCGNYSLYLFWALGAAVLVVLFILRAV